MNSTLNILDVHGMGETPPVSGGSSSRSVLTTIDEVRDACVAVAATARRSLTIYTPDLEPELYDTHAFLEIVKRFVLGRSFARVRVLIAEPMRIIREGNRFLAMGRRLTSYIDLRNVHADYRNARRRISSRTIARSCIACGPTRWDGMAEIEQHGHRSQAHLADFDEVWRASEPEPEVRMMRG